MKHPGLIDTSLLLMRILKCFAVPYRIEPRHNVSCHAGRDGDVESLDGLLRDLASFLDEVRYASIGLV
jgi:hypothetical protein